jgi:DNA polymerase III delta subunit
MDPDAVRELVDALGADMMLIASELEKLLLFSYGRGRITLGDVETMVLSAKQRSSTNSPTPSAPRTVPAPWPSCMAC